MFPISVKKQDRKLRPHDFDSINPIIVLFPDYNEDLSNLVMADQLATSESYSTGQ
jgi:hypothetical protein